MTGYACTDCDREFDSNHAVRVHEGRAHGRYADHNWAPPPHTTLHIRTYTRPGELMHVLDGPCWCEPTVNELHDTTVYEHAGDVQPSVRRSLAVIDSAVMPRRTGMPTGSLLGLVRVARHRR